MEGRKEGKTANPKEPKQKLPGAGDRANELFKSLDSDGDGEITQEEFVNGYLQMHQTVNWANSMNQLYGDQGQAVSDREADKVAAGGGLVVAMNVKQSSLRKMFKKSFR